MLKCSIKRGVSRDVEACFSLSNKISNVKPVAYEDEWSFSLLHACATVS